jgi:hypothetical protein
VEGTPVDSESLLVLKIQWLAFARDKIQSAMRNLLRAASPQVVLIHSDKMKVFRVAEWSQQLPASLCRASVKTGDFREELDLARE